MRVYWDLCEGGRNFGDVLTSELLSHYRMAPTWAPPEDAELIGAGSILEAVPDHYRGAILGTGLMWRSRSVDLSEANVLAIRGRLSARRAGLDSVLLADLGLLAVDLLTGRAVTRRGTGTMRHFVDHRPPMGVAIDPLAHPVEIVGIAATCARLVSSSLHGIVLADSLGIPSMWDPHPDVLGRGFKFADYASAYGEQIKPYQWRQADPTMVRLKQDALRAALESLA